jgi:phosphotransferase family enzyme
VELRALRAARAVADDYGVPCQDAVVLAGGSNVLVHLKPSPAVARVMTATAVLHDDMELWLARELAVGEFLGQRDLAVAPTDLMPPGPHQRDGLWMTVWEFVPHERELPDAREAGHSLRRLHEALADYRGELEPLLGIRDWLERLADSDSLRAKLNELTPLVFDSPQPTQALHGDTGLTNLLRTEKGLLWNDFEDVCKGPVAWDVAGLVVSARVRGQSHAFVDEFLDAYGGPDLDELSHFIEAHELYTAVWQAYDARR